VEKNGVDAETLKAIVANRFHVLKLYGRRVLAPVLHRHASDERTFPRRQIARVRKLMIREDAPLPQDPKARQWLESALQGNQTLRTVYHFMQQLKALCGQSARSDGDRLKRLQAWCTEAEASGIRVLRDFAQQLRAYTAQTA
jgi:stearoyl-CoA desaturase (delta-9 desaturase)